MADLGPSAGQLARRARSRRRPPSRASAPRGSTRPGRLPASTPPERPRPRRSRSRPGAGSAHARNPQDRSRRAEDSSRAAPSASSRSRLAGTPQPDRPDALVEERLDRLARAWPARWSWSSRGSRRDAAKTHVPVPVDDARQDLRPSDVDSDDERDRPRPRATIAPRMAEGVKPYRRYRGGRVKGRVPLDRAKRAPSKPPTSTAPKGRRRWGRIAALAVGGLLLLLRRLGGSSAISRSRAASTRRTSGCSRARTTSSPSTTARSSPTRRRSSSSGRTAPRRPDAATRSARTRSFYCAPIRTTIASPTPLDPARPPR